MICRTAKGNPGLGMMKSCRCTAWLRRARHTAALPSMAGLMAVACHSPALAETGTDPEAGAVEVPVVAAELVSDQDPPAILPETKADGDDLTFIISPYLWLPVVNGDVGGTEPGAISFEVDTGDLLGAFESGGLIHGELRHGSGWGVSIDYMVADLSNTSDIGVVLDTRVDAAIFEATVLRRIALGRHSLDAYAGMRRWASDVVVDVSAGPIGIEILTGDTWTDPILGARYHHAISDRWQLLVQGDVGGFGIDSDFTWHAVAGASYAAGSRTSLHIVYKRLSVSRQSPRIGGGPPVDLDLTVQGPLVGFSWRF